MKTIHLIFAAISLLFNIQTNSFAEDTLFIYSSKILDSSLNTYSRQLTKYIVGQGVTAQQQISGDKILFQKLSDEQFLLMSTDLKIIDSNFNTIQTLVDESALKSNVVYQYYSTNMKLNKNGNFYTVLSGNLYEISATSNSVIRTIILDSVQSINIKNVFIDTINETVVYNVLSETSGFSVYYRKIGEDISYKITHEEFKYFSGDIFSYDEASNQIIYAIKNITGSKQAVLYLFNPVTKEKSQIDVNIGKEFLDATYGNHNDLIDTDTTPINISKDRNLIYIGGSEIINLSLKKRLNIEAADGKSYNVFLNSNDIPAQTPDCTKFSNFKTVFLKLYKQVLEAIKFAATNGCKRDGSTPLDTLTEITTFSKKIKKSIPEQLDGYQAYDYLKITNALATTSDALNKCLKTKKAKPVKFKSSAAKIGKLLESAINPNFSCSISESKKQD